MSVNLITRNFRLYNAKQFKNQLLTYTDDKLYMFLGGIYPWDDDNDPPDVSDNIKTVDIDIWRKIAGLKKFSSADVSFSVPRFDWTGGTVYTQYDSNIPFYDTGIFYVITNAYNVYICLDNNGNTSSTVKPTSTAAIPFKTSDGYIWKYLYTVSTGDALKFLSQTYMPVKTLTADDGSDQWSVQSGAVDGEIVRVDVASGGSTYTSNSGTVVTATSNTIRFASTASSVTDIYQGYNVYILTGTGQGELRTVSSYNGSTKTATLSSNWTNTPTNSSTYIVSPPLTVSGDLGTGFSAYTEVSNGHISKVNILNRGSGYRNATVAATVGGTGAVFTVIYSPKGGIGKDPVRDLFAHNVTINTKFQSSESGYIFTNNDFRTVGIIANPQLVNGSLANASLYDNTTRLTVSSIQKFSVDETIVGSTSGATAKVVKYPSSTVITLTEVVGQFQIGENITGNSSGVVGYISNKTEPTLKQFSGDILYVRNQEPVRRSFSQTEDFKITIKF